MDGRASDLSVRHLVVLDDHQLDVLVGLRIRLQHAPGCSGFRVQSSGSRVPGPGLRVPGPGSSERTFRGWDSECRVCEREREGWSGRERERERERGERKRERELEQEREKREMERERETER